MFMSCFVYVILQLTRTNESDKQKRDIVNCTDTKALLEYSIIGVEVLQ